MGLTEDNMQFQARLVLSDGLIYTGVSLGAAGETIGEVVFNTAMSGYQEILTDPSYHGQIVTMTYPQIGNYGVNSQDIESRKIFAAGFIIREYSPIVSHWQAQKSLDEYLKHNGIVGICEVDTRSLTRHLRDEGAQMGIISTLNSSDRELLEKVNKYPTLVGRDIVREVITDSPYELPVDKNTGSNSENTAYKVAVYDYGIKYSILRKLRSFGCKLKVFPANTLPEDIMLWKPDGLFLSNGPGDPEPLDYAIKSINALLGKIPVFGVCLGHQLLCLALNGKITKLKFGHHGANHPVKNMVDNSIEITSQNHGFVVDIDSLSSGDIEITHINLNDGTLEGFRHRSIPAFSVQYHPEAAPGPHDSHYLFEQFITYMKDFHA